MFNCFESENTAEAMQENPHEVAQGINEVTEAIYSNNYPAEALIKLYSQAQELLNECPHDEEVSKVREALNNFIKKVESKENMNKLLSLVGKLSEIGLNVDLGIEKPKYDKNFGVYKAKGNERTISISVEDVIKGLAIAIKPSLGDTMFNDAKDNNGYQFDTLSMKELEAVLEKICSTSENNILYDILTQLNNSSKSTLKVVKNLQKKEEEVSVSSHKGDKGTEIYLSANNKVTKKQVNAVFLSQLLSIDSVIEAFNFSSEEATIDLDDFNDEIKLAEHDYKNDVIEVGRSSFKVKYESGKGWETEVKHSDKYGYIDDINQPYEDLVQVTRMLYEAYGENTDTVSTVLKVISQYPKIFIDIIEWPGKYKKLKQVHPSVCNWMQETLKVFEEISNGKISLDYLKQSIK